MPKMQKGIEMDDRKGEGVGEGRMDQEEEEPAGRRSVRAARCRRGREGGRGWSGRLFATVRLFW